MAEMSIKDTINRIPAAWKLPLIVGAVIVFLLVGWLYGTRITNGIGSWWFARAVAKDKAEIQSLKDDAVKQKALVQDLVNAFEAQKLVTAEETKKRESLEVILADKSKTTDQKLKAYNDVLAKSPTVTPPESTDQLCARAKALGLSCGN